MDALQNQYKIATICNEFVMTCNDQTHHLHQPSPTLQPTIEVKKT